LGSAHEPNDAKTIERMLESLASSISRRAGVPIRKIFINHRAARSGMVFDDGKIAKW